MKITAKTEKRFLGVDGTESEHYQDIGGFPKYSIKEMTHVMQDYAEGAIIEGLLVEAWKRNTDWFFTEKPLWNWDKFIYRVRFYPNEFEKAIQVLEENLRRCCVERKEVEEDIEKNELNYRDMKWELNINGKEKWLEVLQKRLGIKS